MACSVIPIQNIDLECSFVEREKHRIDLSFEGTVTRIEELGDSSRINFGKIISVIHSEIRHIFQLGQRYRVSIWNDGSVDLNLLGNGE